MKRRNISDFTDIQEFPTTVMYSTHDGLKPYILHIVKRQGLTKDKTSFHITECNRPLENASIYSKNVLPDDHFFWQLCPRCGTRKNFQVALNEYHVWLGKRSRKQAEELAHAWEGYLEALRQVANVLNTTNTFQAEVDEKHGRVIIKRTESPEEWLEVTQYRDR